MSKLRGASLPNLGKLDLSKLDVDSMTAAAKRAGSFGQQVSEVATAVEKARKK